MAALFVEVGYAAVEAEGVAEYEVESRPVILAQPVWQLAEAFNQIIGDSAPAGGNPDTTLSQDDWHFYAVNIPDGNAGVLRTLLESVSGNPDLYLRAGNIPTTDHKAAGLSGQTLYERRLNATTTEYGNWVPDSGRKEKQLNPGTWYLGVKAASARNAAYRLRASSGNTTALSMNAGSVTGETLAGGDWRYYRFTPPADLPETWTLQFNRTQGNAAMFIRDVIPPGEFTSSSSLRGDFSDLKNSGTYGSTATGYTSSDPVIYRAPLLRAGHVYWVGVRATTDSAFSLTSTTTGNISTLPSLALSGGTFNETLAAGESRLFRVTAPRGATRLSATFATVGLDVRVEQASPPGTTGNSHARRNTGTLSQTLTSDPASAVWPWLSGYDYYLRVTNTSSGPLAPALAMTGLQPASPDSDGDGLLDSWERTHFSNSLTSNGATNDPDGDGIANIMEYALGSSPRSAANGTNPIRAWVDAAGCLVLEVTRPAGIDQTILQYEVEFSSDMVNWAADGRVMKNSTAVLEVQDKMAGAAKRWARLRVRRAVP